MLVPRRTALAAMAAALALRAGPARAEFPDRPIRLVVPFAAGGSTDVVARIVAAEMTRLLGQPVVVENRPGAGGSVGSAEVARAAPDGHTLLAATVSTHAINPSLYARLPFDAGRDFSAVTHLVDVPNVLVMNPAVPASSVAELRDYARAHPGRLNYASPGTGSIGHLQSHWFARLIGAEITHIPYRGAGPALQDVVAGQVQLMIDNVPTSLAHIRSGAVRALVVPGRERVPQLPDVPSAPEAGLPDFIGASWVALLAPRGTPEATVAALHAAARRALDDAQVRERLTQLSATPVGSGPADTAAFVEDERRRWAPVVRATSVTLD